METPVPKAILYDDNCPMCALYTQGFVQWGVLRPENRVPFANLDQALKTHPIPAPLDYDRARHEIPLLDLTGDPTLYGLDAMLYLLSQRMPWFRHIAHIPRLYHFFKFLYNLVSYNRRVIIPNSKPAVHFDCAPDFHRGYRFAFIFYAILVASAVTYAFGESVAPYGPFEYTGLKMLVICGTGWVMQMIFATLFLQGKRVDYLGHLAVLMILGVLVLLPGIVLSMLTHYQYPAVPAGSVLLSSALMTWQHVRRIDHLRLSQAWTIAWLLILPGTAAGWLYGFSQ